MAKSIALSRPMDVFIITDGTTVTELSLSVNGVRVEIENEELQVTSAEDLPNTTESDTYSTVNAQYTVVYYEANEVLGVVGIEEIVSGITITGDTYDLENGAAFNIRRLGNNLIISKY